MNSGIIASSRLRNNIKTYFVRPTSASTYGNGDGLSYANAWNGQADLTANSATLEGQNLVICDTHVQSISIPCNLNQLSFDTVTSVGKIDATGLGTGLSIVGFNVNEFVNSDIQNSNIQNLYLEDCTINYTGLHNFSGSGNQGIQNWGGTVATYKSGCEIIADNCDDEGISGHLDAVNIFEVGSMLRARNNTQAGVNYIETCKFTFSGNVDFSGNGTYDIYATAPSGAIGDLQLNINTNDVIGNIQVDGGTLNTTNAVITNCIVGSNSVLNANNSVIDLVTGASFTGNINTTKNTVIKAFASMSSSVDYNFADSKIISRFTAGSNFTAIRTLFDAQNATDHTITANSGSTINVNYCTFINTVNAKFMMIINSGATVVNIDNNTVQKPTGGTGRGLLTQVSCTINNWIFKDCSLVTFTQNSATLTANSCNFSGSSGAGSGTGTFVNNNEVIGDPLFEDASTLDFRLGVGSPCLDGGVVVPETEGINTADWNSEPVAVTSKTQTAPFDVGAYVS